MSEDCNCRASICCACPKCECVNVESPETCCNRDGCNCACKNTGAICSCDECVCVVEGGRPPCCHDGCRCTCKIEAEQSGIFFREEMEREASLAVQGLLEAEGIHSHDCACAEDCQCSKENHCRRPGYKLPDKNVAACHDGSSKLSSVCTCDCCKNCFCGQLNKSVQVSEDPKAGGSSQEESVAETEEQEPISQPEPAGELNEQEEIPAIEPVKVHAEIIVAENFQEEFAGPIDEVQIEIHVADPVVLRIPELLPGLPQDYEAGVHVPLEINVPAEEEDEEEGNEAFRQLLAPGAQFLPERESHSRHEVGTFNGSINNSLTTALGDISSLNDVVLVHVKPYGPLEVFENRSDESDSDEESVDGGHEPSILRQALLAPRQNVPISSRMTHFSQQSVSAPPPQEYEILQQSVSAPPPQEYEILQQSVSAPPPQEYEILQQSVSAPQSSPPQQPQSPTATQSVEPEQSARPQSAPIPIPEVEKSLKMQSSRSPQLGEPPIKRVASDSAMAANSAPASGTMLMEFDPNVPGPSGVKVESCIEVSETDTKGAPSSPLKRRLRGMSLEESELAPEMIPDPLPTVVQVQPCVDTVIEENDSNAQDKEISDSEKNEDLENVEIEIPPLTPSENLDNEKLSE